MTDVSLKQQVNDLLVNSPLEDELVDFWQPRLDSMNDGQLTALLNLLQNRLAILTEANATVLKMAEDAADYNRRQAGIIPQTASILDMPIESMAALFRDDVLGVLADDSLDLFSQLDEYMIQDDEIGDDIGGQLNLLADSLLDNQEVLFNVKNGSRVTVGAWLHSYQAFGSDKVGGSSLRRVNFINQYDPTKRLTESERNMFLKLLKLYDYCQETTIDDILDRQEQANQEKIETKRFASAQQPAKASGPAPVKIINQNADQEIKNLEAMAKLYPVGSLEYMAIEEEIARLKHNTQS